MAPLSPSKKKWLTHEQKLKYSRTLAFFLCGLVAAAAAGIYAAERIYNKKRYHTSHLTGRKWLDELLAGNDNRIKDQFGMSKHVFRKLVKELFKKTSLTDS